MFRVLILPDKLVGIFKVHIGGVDRGIGGGEGQASEGVAAGTVGDGALHDLFADGGGHWGLVVSNSVMGISKVRLG
jgi:hypothetical protein